MRVEPYAASVAGPYPEDAPRMNPTAFTPMQTEAIRSAMNPGLTVVVGPPGTGKTDTAVQIISNLVHTFPAQRVLVVTHSNQALNDVFDKLTLRHVDERYMLRLGHGEALLESEHDFTKAGRVNHMLSRRLELLARVERLASALHVAADVGYTCETAGYFWTSHVLARWEAFVAAANEARDADARRRGGSGGGARRRRRRRRGGGAAALPLFRLFRGRTRVAALQGRVVRGGHGRRGGLLRPPAPPLCRARRVPRL